MGFGNWLILSQLSGCCLMHAKHLAPAWACEYGQGAQSLQREVAGRGRGRAAGRS